MTQDAIQAAPHLHDAVRAIVVEELEIEPDELSETALFEDEYDADSLSLLAIVARFESELGIIIPADRVGELLSLDKVLAAVGEFAGATTHV